MKCFFCARGMSTGDNLFRINPKGQKGIWACGEHYAQTDSPPIDAEIKELVAIIGKAPAP